MTLLDAPVFDAARERRRSTIWYSALGLLLVSVCGGWWLVAGRPVDWPWNWNHYLMGRRTVNAFLTAVEKNDLPKAYSIWIHDKNWQQHPQQTGPYPFSRFEQDWSRNQSRQRIRRHPESQDCARGRYGNGVLVAILINGRKSGALNLDYDPKSDTLSFAPPGVALYLGP